VGPGGILSLSKVADVLEFGSEAQRIAACLELKQLLDHCFQDAVTSVVRVLARMAHSWSPPLQRTASEVLIKVVQRSVPMETGKLIAVACFQVVKSAKSEDLYEVWGDILVSILPRVVWKSTELQRVFALVDAHAGRKAVISRKLAARLLGSLSLSLPQGDVERQVLWRALRLSEDENHAVRGMATEALAFISAALNVRLVESTIWPRIEALLKDGNARIHAATLRTMGFFFDAHRRQSWNAALFHQLLPPVFARHCIFARKAVEQDQRLIDDDSYLLLEIFAEVFGQLCYSISPYFPDENFRRGAFHCFVALSTCNGPVIRRHCAYNLPGVTRSFQGRYEKELSGLAEFLSRDQDKEVRWNLAASLKPTIDELPHHDSTVCENFYTAINSLLRDRDHSVRLKILEDLSLLLRALDPQSKTSMRRLPTILEAFVVNNERRWRTQEIVIRELRIIAPELPIDILVACVDPIFERTAEESCYHVRIHCMEGLVEIIGRSKDAQTQRKLAEKFVASWCQAGTFWRRLSFLEGVFHSVHCLDPVVIRDLLAPHALTLAKDPVPNVRLRLARSLHLLYPILQSGPALDEAAALLKKDSDPDVFSCMASFDPTARLVSDASAMEVG